ncbi:MAG: hypothetical protein AUH75_10285 [Gemmatimonadetes bacterium 13_1_40CM_4_65_7]|nr:MAG: hypothetical protein AUH75_10285 [Gemmatimonadetes bacterium 13_1_40CM_4_65_7]
MSVQEYTRRFLDVETRLSDRTTRAHEDARAQAQDWAGDAGDASVADETVRIAGSDRSRLGGLTQFPRGSVLVPAVNR